MDSTVHGGRVSRLGSFKWPPQTVWLLHPSFLLLPSRRTRLVYSLVYWVGIAVMSLQAMILNRAVPWLERQGAHMLRKTEDE